MAPSSLTRARTCHDAKCFASASTRGNAERGQRHHHDRARQQAPAARDDGCDHHHAEAPPFDAAATDDVAHDDEWCRKNEQWYRGEGGRARPALQQPKARRPPRYQLIAARKQARDRKTDREREDGLDLFHCYDAPLTIPRRSFAEVRAGRHHILNKGLTPPAPGHVSYSRLIRFALILGA